MRNKSKIENKMKRERDAGGETGIIGLSKDPIRSRLSGRPFKRVRLLDGNEPIDLTN
jgi:hypothetical protein